MTDLLKEPKPSEAARDASLDCFSVYEMLERAYAIDVAPLIAENERLTKERDVLSRRVDTEILSAKAAERQNAALVEALRSIRDMETPDIPDVDFQRRARYDLQEIARAAIAQLDAPQHASDCAVHNEPALPNGPCDCGVIDAPPTEPTVTDE